MMANKANAQRSTGPKTVAGKRRASQNARAHGLSVPMDLHAMETKVQQLASLIEAEGATGVQARQLAVKIIDFERNEQHERECYARDFLGVGIGWQGPDAKLRQERMARQQHFRDRLGNPLYTSMRRMDQDQRDQYNALVRAMLFLVRLHARWDQHQVQMALRYYKRAGNQLVKALRALDSTHEFTKRTQMHEASSN
jgi:hypothetical protein